MSPAKRPSYLKRQKEQKRLARAAEKREARRTRKHSTETEIEDPEGQEPAGMETDSGEEAAV
jgi:hypothetical protein